MSFGQQLTRRFLERFLHEPFVENHRPDWLFGMELDFFFPGLNFAVEFNGDQHYFQTDFGNPLPQITRDEHKKRLCNKRGVQLLVIQAIDLQKHVIKRKLKKCLPGLPKRRVNMKQCQLERDAVAYRKSLIKSYDSPTARKRGRKPREQAKEKRAALTVISAQDTPAGLHRG